MDAPRPLAVEEAAAHVGKSAKTTYRWKTQGLIAPYGERWELMFLDIELDAAKTACAERKARNPRGRRPCASAGS
ncbi:hypothetical protein [Segniliparus rugosus]|uniref:Helix-turn-helix domain-containing protein n=1 Tax=Segniliparus rugosus (strain ATCC BAA-974 / DSM 45345 / CCUG 50838 / CIP 108380 / JCM 13579 / CDC 945) TaxID=679197 RepID=E5XR51_SEGRC|nr:hypothetical protein [Segniliparus rugosus]EFV13144.2 hypothetical protein HMPREF9336_01973 [Segniliparus rugosus ATCC BAA-974]